MKDLPLKAFAAPLVLLALAGEFFFYSAFVAPRREAAVQLEALSSTLAKQPVAAVIPSATTQASSATVPELLARVQELALSTGITVAAVEPVAATAGEFKMSLDAGYAGLIRFLARFETLQVQLRGFNIVPAEGRNTLKVELTFAHTPAPSSVHPKLAAEFEDKLRKMPLADPFHPYAGAMAVVPESDPSDLTWSFHLTSISEIGDRKYATIDGREYQPGDELAGRTIRDIGQDSVTLTEKVERGERRVFLRFREAFSDRI